VSVAASLARPFVTLLSPPGERRRLHEPDLWLLATLLVLAMFGTVMVFSASFALGVRQPGSNGYSYLIRHLLWLSVGLVGMTVAYLIDYRVWRRVSLLGMVLALALLALVLVPGLGVEIWGAQRWIHIGPLSIQPAELAKLALVVYLADWLAQKGVRIRQFSYGLVPFTLLIGLLVGLVMLQPDLGSSAVLAAIGISMFFVAGAPLFQFALLLVSGGAAFLMLALSAPYRRDRLLLFLSPDRDLLDPESKLLGLGWQIAQARLAFGSGGLFGVGLGASRQKFLWLFAAHSDAIFAVIGEELGLVGCLFVIGLFLFLAWRGYRIARKAPDSFGSLLAVGITTWVIAQAAMNIGGITSTIPFTGIPLPFLSYGGSSLAVTLTAMGILLNISRATVRAREFEPGERAAAPQPEGFPPRVQARPEPSGVPVHRGPVMRGTFGRGRRARPRRWVRSAGP
jgi:cell division protein FtsW